MERGKSQVSVFSTEHQFFHSPSVFGRAIWEEMCMYRAILRALLAIQGNGGKYSSKNCRRGVSNKPSIIQWRPLLILPANERLEFVALVTLDLLSKSVISNQFLLIMKVHVMKTTQACRLREWIFCTLGPFSRKSWAFHAVFYCVFRSNTGPIF